MDKIDQGGQDTPGTPPENGGGNNNTSGAPPENRGGNNNTSGIPPENGGGNNNTSGTPPENGGGNNNGQSTNTGSMTKEFTLTSAATTFTGVGVYSESNSSNSDDSNTSPGISTYIGIGVASIVLLSAFIPLLRICLF